MSSRTPVRGPERFAVQPVAPPKRSAGNVLGAALLLLLLLVALPVGLWVLSGPPPVPTSLPDRSDLSQPLSVDALFVVLRAVVWLAWLQFAFCTLVEVVSVVRGGELPRPVPLSGRSQALARALVGTLLVGTSFLSSTAANAVTATSSAPTTTTVAAVQQAVAQEEASSVDSVEAGAETGAEQVTVERMEHVPGVPPSMTDVIGRKVAIVEPPKGHYHDNLWDIAERSMGDGRRWKEIYELNKGRVQPDGQQLVLGRLIQPGWVLIMPEDAQGVVRVKAQTAPATPAPVAPAPAEQTPAPAEQEQAPITEQQVSMLAGGGVLAAILLGALITERRRRRTRAVEAAEGELEVELRYSADVIRSSRLNRALRALPALCQDARLPLPQVYAATIGDEALELHLAPPAPEAPTPWTARDGGARWELPHGAQLPADSGPAPYPALVCLGRDDDGRDVFLDIEALGGSVSVAGSHAMARELVSAVAVQLAYAPWADQQSVHGYRLDEATAVVAGDRFTEVDDLAALITEWRVQERHRPANDVLSGRLRRAAGSGAAHLVLGDIPDASTVAGLTDLMGEHDRGVGILSAVPIDGARWTLTIDDAGRLQVPLLDVEVEAVRVAASSAESLAGLFEKSRTAEPLPSDDRVPVPAPPRSGEDDHWSTAPVRVGVLGDLVVRPQGQLDPARVALATEVAIFLALQTAPVHRNVVGASVWPTGVTTEVRDATIDRVRDWLGTDPDGNHLLGENEEGRLFLSDAVAVDWHAFCSLALRARAVSPAEEPEVLRRALQLVRGEFLTRRPVQRYAWLARTRVERQAADLVVDTAHRLVSLSLPADPEGGAAAARAGLRHVPTSQVLWRDLVLTEFHDPRGPGAQAVVAEMRRSLQRYGAPVEPETEALLEELLPGGRAGTGELA